VPLQWAGTQHNRGYTLARLGERESGTARLGEAVGAWDACLTVIETAWPAECGFTKCARIVTRHERKSLNDNPRNKLSLSGR
jgi:hypothetical protein